MYENIQVNRNFRTLASIADERKIDLLQNQNALIENKILELKPQIDSLVSEEYEKKKLHILKQKELSTAQNALELLQELYSYQKFMAKTYREENDEEKMFELLEHIAKLKTTTVDEYPMEKEKIAAEIAAMKLCLAKSAEAGKLDEAKEVLKLIKEYDEKFLSVMDSDELKSTMVENECTLNTADLAELDKKYLDENFDSLKKIPLLQQQEADKLSEINKLAIDLNIPHREFEALLGIEKDIKTIFSEEIAADYLGPVFQYLDSSSGLDIKMWDQIAPIAKAIVFKTISSMHIYLSNASNDRPSGGFTYYAIENFPIKIYNENVHDAENLISMKKLIRSDLESEELKNFLFTLFYDYILADGDEWEERDDLEMFCIKSSDGKCSVTTQNKIVEIKSEWNNIWEVNERSPLAAIQSYYKLIKEYLVIQSEISKNLVTRSTAKYEFNLKKEEITQQELNKLSKKTVIKEDTNHLKMVTAAKEIHNEISKLLTTDNEDLKNWDIDKLKKDAEKFSPSELAQNYYQKIAALTDEYNFENESVRESVIELIVNFINIYNKNEEFSPTNLKFLRESKEYENLIEEKRREIQDLYDSIVIYVEDFEKLSMSEQIKKFNKLYANIISNDQLVKYLEDDIKEIYKKTTFNFKQSVYDEFENQDNEVIKNEISEAYKRLITIQKLHRIDLKNIDESYYHNLVDSLGKIREYSNEEVYASVKVKKRAYPLMNMVVVKILKDTVQNFTVTYNSVLSDYINYSHLFFNTKAALSDETNDGNFSWNCFDITRLKSIDFVENWKDEKRVLPTLCRQLIKGLLLMIHIINYISVFKFIIISEKIFEVNYLH